MLFRLGCALYRHRRAVLVVWGLVLLGFGLAMLALARRARRDSAA